MRWLPLLALTLMMPLAGCATTRPAAYVVEPNGPYTLDTGDVVRVTVYGDQELSNTYRVSDAGAIAFDMANQVFGGDFTARLNMNLREDKHWAYGAYSFTSGALGQRLLHQRRRVDEGAAPQGGVFGAQRAEHLPGWFFGLTEAARMLRRSSSDPDSLVQ